MGWFGRRELEPFSTDEEKARLNKGGAYDNSTEAREKGAQAMSAIVEKFGTVPSLQDESLIAIQEESKLPPRLAAMCAWSEALLTDPQARENVNKQTSVLLGRHFAKNFPAYNEFIAGRHDPEEAEVIMGLSCKISKAFTD